MCPYRVVNVGHLQQVLGAAVLLHLYGLPAPLHRYAVIFGEVRVWGHLQISTLKDDLVDVVLVFPWRSSISKHIKLLPYFTKLIHFTKLMKVKHCVFS